MRVRPVSGGRLSAAAHRRLREERSRSRTLVRVAQASRTLAAHHSAQSGDRDAFCDWLSGTTHRPPEASLLSRRRCRAALGMGRQGSRSSSAAGRPSSASRAEGEVRPKGRNWACECGFAQNFPDRLACFKCQLQRPADAEAKRHKPAGKGGQARSSGGDGKGNKGGVNANAGGNARVERPAAAKNAKQLELDEARRTLASSKKFLGENSAGILEMQQTVARLETELKEEVPLSKLLDKVTDDIISAQSTLTRVASEIKVAEQRVTSLYERHSSLGEKLKKLTAEKESLTRRQLVSLGGRRSTSPVARSETMVEAIARAFRDGKIQVQPPTAEVASFDLCAALSGITGELAALKGPDPADDAGVVAPAAPVAGVGNLALADAAAVAAMEEDGGANASPLN